jgi:hypothetical protein
MRDINWKRAIIAGLIANIASFFVGGGGYVLFGSVFALEPTFIWRWTPQQMFNMPAGWFVYLVVGNTVLAVAVAVVYAMLVKGIPGKGIRKGLVYGVIIWVIGVLPAVFTIHVLTVMNDMAVLYFTTQSFFEHLCYGAIIAAIYGDPSSHARDTA